MQTTVCILLNQKKPQTNPILVLEQDFGFIP